MCLYYWQYDVLLFLIKRYRNIITVPFLFFSVTEFFGLNNLFFIIIRRYISYLCDITMWLFSSTIHIIYNYFTIRQIEVSCFFIELKLFILNSFYQKRMFYISYFYNDRSIYRNKCIKTYYLFRIFLVGYY
ncbi:Uncharacterised protein [Proteus mirabilis]|uniref:Uncharacterized protein n=1 Tax=Proteus mirabilis TaxID=584 RepID=A0A2X2BWZ8_PROMI|nr:Uncharacterised protein [Proteus mirabilis]